MNIATDNHSNSKWIGICTLIVSVPLFGIIATFLSLNVPVSFLIQLYIGTVAGTIFGYAGWKIGIRRWSTAVVVGLGYAFVCIGAHFIGVWRTSWQSSIYNLPQFVPYVANRISHSYGLINDLMIWPKVIAVSSGWWKFC
jgi:hypothetical protein